MPSSHSQAILLTTRPSSISSISAASPKVILSAACSIVTMPTKKEGGKGQAKTKGKDQKGLDDSAGSKIKPSKAKGAQSINVRHILVSKLAQTITTPDDINLIEPPQ